MGFLDGEWICLRHFGEVLGFLNIGWRQFQASWIEEVFVQVFFREVSSFLDMGLGFSNIGLDIVPRLLKRRMGDFESFELKKLVALW